MDRLDRLDRPIVRAMTSSVYVLCGKDELVAVVSAKAAGVTSVKFTNKNLSDDDRQWIAAALEKMLAGAPFGSGSGSHPDVELA